MNVIEIGMAFLEGLALIVSPCILPILPIMLSTSLGGGKARPFGIIIGFSLSFSTFVLLSRQLVNALHIHPDVIRNASMVLLGCLGLILLFGSLSQNFSLVMQPVAGIGNKLSATEKYGFAGGLVVGALIGLIWTPCAGPILAAVLVGVIRQQTNLQGVLITLAFSLGAGVPMLVIALAGHGLIKKLNALKYHTEALRRGFGIIILTSVAFIGLQSQAEIPADMPVIMPDQATAATAAMLKSGIKHPYFAPEFAGLDGWLNSEPLTMASLRGKVVLVDFWTYSCINCVRTLPYVTAWDREYRDKGLVVIGIHSPEFEFEKNKDNVKAALAAHGIQYPVALDNNLDTWTAFHNQYWPAHYLIDQQGHVVYTHFGEGHYAETENNIRYLLGLDKKADAAPEARVTSEGQTPETYLGYNRGERFASPEDVKPDEAQNYTAPAELPVNKWALSGKWKIGDQSIAAEDAGASILLKFHAGKVYLVLGTESGEPVKASLALNGKPLGAEAGKDAPDSVVTIGKYTLYELVCQKAVKDGLLEIKSEQAGLTAYAFTFGG